MSSSPAPESSGSGSAVKEMASTSNPSSEVSIEELGAEEDLDNCEKVEHAQEIVTDDSKGPRDESEPEKKDEDKDKDQDKDKEEVEEIVGVPKKAEAVEEIRTSGAEEIARMVAKEEREALLESDDDDEDDDWDDETLLERLVGLTEMFPEGLRNGSCALISGGVGSIKWVYKNSR